ncbi:MAG: hypothetical protein H0T89_09820, partial [Deltaproteobacteria bacterium]|nr:hypothetical protein [Deltaproteobacteria bacterium]
ERDREAAARALGLASAAPIELLPCGPIETVHRTSGRATVELAIATPASVPNADVDDHPLTRTIAMLRRRAEAERASMVAEVARPRRRWPVLAALLLVIGAVIGWQLARLPVAGPVIESRLTVISK